MPTLTALLRFERKQSAPNQSLSSFGVSMAPCDLTALCAAAATSRSLTSCFTGERRSLVAACARPVITALDCVLSACIALQKLNCAESQPPIKFSVSFPELTAHILSLILTI